jgi:hypothetical protein
LYGGDDVIQLRPAIPFMVVNIDSMCEPISGKAASCPSMRFAGPEIQKFVSKVTAQNLNLC